MNPPTIVAEMSANHMGLLHRAHAIIDAAAEAGADAIKLQTFTPEQMCKEDVVLTKGPWLGATLLDLYKQAHTPREWHQELFEHAKARGLVAFSSVFHPDDVDFLEALNCPMYKIASFELTDLALIDHAARTGKPIIISTGMATEAEIDGAFFRVTSESTLLKCTSAYPATLESLNLATITDMREKYGNNVGLSDHTLGHTAAVVATVLGATMIEKHLTLARADGGPDAAFSAEPRELAALVRACRKAAAAVGEVHYGPVSAEAESLPLRRQPGGKRGQSATKHISFSRCDRCQPGYACYEGPEVCAHPTFHKEYIKWAE